MPHPQHHKLDGIESLIGKAEALIRETNALLPMTGDHKQDGITVYVVGGFEQAIETLVVLRDEINAYDDGD